LTAAVVDGESGVVALADIDPNEARQRERLGNNRRDEGVVEEIQVCAALGEQEIVRAGAAVIGKDAENLDGDAVLIGTRLVGEDGFAAGAQEIVAQICAFGKHRAGRDVVDARAGPEQAVDRLS